MSKRQTHDRTPQQQSLPIPPAESGALFSETRGHGSPTFHHVVVGRSDAVTDADRVRRLLASLITRRILKEKS